MPGLEDVCCAVTQAGARCARPLHVFTNRSDERKMLECLPMCGPHLKTFVEHARYSAVVEHEEIPRREYAEPEPDNRPRYVYYLRRADGLIKIGYSVNPDQRQKTLEREHGSLERLALEIGGLELEKVRHIEFTAHRAFGEWFKPGADLMEHIGILGRRNA